MTYLNFVTLNTGRSDRVDPPPAGVTASAALDLARALRDGRTAVSSRAGYELVVETVGPALLATVFRGSKLPLTTFGVAARSRGAATLWTLLHETAPYDLATDPSSAPQAPWCAVRAEPTLMQDPDEPWRWLAAYELEVATAWIERRHRHA